MNETAEILSISRRRLQDLIKDHPHYRLERKPEAVFKCRHRPADRGSAMPLKLHPPRQGQSPNWRIRGTHFGIRVDPGVRTLLTAGKRKSSSSRSATTSNVVPLPRSGR